MSARATSKTLHDYPVQLDRYDEAVEPSGEARPAWRTLSRTIARMSTAELVDRQRQADRLVEAEGASYLFHDGGTDSSRPWRLDPVFGRQQECAGDHHENRHDPDEGDVQGRPQPPVAGPPLGVPHNVPEEMDRYDATNTESS